MKPELTLSGAISKFGDSVLKKLKSPSVSGEPEEQLRTPLDILIREFVELLGHPRESVDVIGETKITELKTRPDFAILRTKLLVGFIEVKAPGKGADPRRFKDPHDKAQWEKLKSLPNLIYTDGNAFSLWHDGELVALIHLEGEIESAGKALRAPETLLKLFSDFLLWEPQPPRTAKQLAEQSARLCRFLRDEVAEHLAAGSPSLTALAAAWRKMLFPDATDQVFADGYAQALTFGLLIARARGIRLADGLDRVAQELGGTDSIIAAALRIVTLEVENDSALQTSLQTLVRVLDVVHWDTISQGRPDTWLYFYEDFLEVYDNALRKKTGSYYTPPQVVDAMVRLVDEALRSPDRFQRPRGLAAKEVMLADPAVGTGTFMLGVLRRIAETTADNEGEGAIPGAINAAIARLIAFEMQLGPFAVAQLRILAEMTRLIGAPPRSPIRMYVTDTLGNPNIEEEQLPGFAKIAESRRQANKIKKSESITVVIGNPPYKEKAKGLGGWIEAEKLREWQPPVEWKVSAHAKHLRNLYIYFWRWATWKVFEQQAETGIVCFITVAGFLNGPGFQKMRDSLRRRATEIWVIDCSPEGHQPDVPTRIFQGVQQPVCIVLAARVRRDDDTPATVRFRALPAGARADKFAALTQLTLDGDGWVECPTDWRAPFLPTSSGAWSTFPALDDYFIYNGSGVMPGRTWVIAPDAETLQRRWHSLIHAPQDQQEDLFQPHMRGGTLGDKHLMKPLKEGLHAHELRSLPVGKDQGECIPPVRYAFRSFDRQWIIPDARIINQSNPQLWDWLSRQQVHLTAPSDRSPTNGPGLTFTQLIPDLHHYNGRGGRVFPLYQGDDQQDSNLRPALLKYLSDTYQQTVTGEQLYAYIAAIAANPAYTAKFQDDLTQPGLRIPLTADAQRFAEAVQLGQRVIWLHTFGERCVDAKAGRPPGSPRLPKQQAPRIPKNGAIPDTPDLMPETIDYDPAQQRLLVGTGFIDHVTPAMWDYEVSGKQVLRHWFSYRQKDRTRPVMGDRRPPSQLGEIQPDHWIADYTTDLIDLLHVLGLVIELEPQQADSLEQICKGLLLSRETLDVAGVWQMPGAATRPRRKDAKGQLNLLDGLD